jgi:ABC-type transporter Mla maintaining outer membrane lipid asymmetry ATPase subunit MlaF
MAETIIELQDVSFSAQDMPVVRNISFAVKEGTSLALVGPSGGGKSTALKLAAGLLVPTGGKALFRGKNIALMNRAQNLAFRRESAVVFQDSALWSNQDLYQSLELPLRIHYPMMAPAEREARVAEALRDVGYIKDVHIRPAMLSMGEQKLIGFARSMILRPRLLFLDEWTESLDDAAADRLMALALKLREEKRTIIFVSHDFRIIKNFADHIVMIGGGKLLLRLSRDQIAEDENLSKMIERGIAS